MKKKYKSNTDFEDEDEKIVLGKEWKEESEKSEDDYFKIEEEKLDDEKLDDEKPPEDPYKKGKTVFIAAIVAIALLGAVGAFFVLPAIFNVDIVKEISAKLSLGGEDKTASAVVTAKPVITSVAIAEAPTTNKNEITLKVNAKADQCRFSSDGKVWSAWRAYKAEEKWTLDGSEGQKTVYVQCKNKEGNNETKSAKIYFDNTAPSMSLDARTENNSIIVDAKGEDSNPFGATCTLLLNDKEIDKFIGDYSKKLAVDAGSYKVTLVCYDAADNQVSAEKSVEIVKKVEKNETTSTTQNTTTTQQKKERKISIIINNGDAETNSRYLTLTLYATDGYLCRYKEEGGEWTPYEKYTPQKTWTSNAWSSQTITIYYECNDENGTFIGQAKDSIEYVKLNGGSSSTSGSSSGGSGGSNGGSSGGTTTLKINSLALRPVGGFAFKPGFTNQYRLTLNLDAVNAKECRYRNIPWEPQPVWSDWFPYTTSKEIEVMADRGGDGDRVVEIECRDSKNNTVSRSASLIYDNTPPQEVDTSRPEDMSLIYSETINGTTKTYIKLIWLAVNDATSGVYRYVISKMNVSSGEIVSNYKVINAGSDSSYEFTEEVDPTDQYVYGFSVYDNAGNRADSARLLYCDPSQPLPATCS